MIEQVESVDAEIQKFLPSLNLKLRDTADPAYSGHRRKCFGRWSSAQSETEWQVLLMGAPPTRSVLRPATSPNVFCPANKVKGRAGLQSDNAAELEIA